jgi:hypothetical protein
MAQRPAPKGLEDSAQGFNPGNPPPKRCALKGRQIRYDKTHAENELAHVTSRPFSFQGEPVLLNIPRVETLGLEFGHFETVKPGEILDF